MTDWIGKKIGNYEIRQLLARGGAGRVYKAFQPSLERHVAIKMIRSELASDSSVVEHFRREANPK